MMRSEIAVIVLSAAVLVAASFVLQSRIDLTFSDEGYIWYGSWRTALGEVPLRDFRAYQPGRYVWSASWSFVLGNGILGLRASAALFQFIGLAFGLAAVRRISASWLTVWGIGFLFLLWMYPYYKIFEHALILIFLYTSIVLIEAPTLRRHFGIGVLVGLMAMFGETDAFTGTVSSFGLILFIWFKADRSDLLKKLAAWAAGITVGYLPMLVAFVLLPGFFESFLQRIFFVFQRDTLNLPLPVPWPWTINFNTGKIKLGHHLSKGIFFLLLPSFCAIVGFYLIRMKDDLKTRAPLIASFFTLSTYIFYSFSRADIGHLTFSIPPLILGILSLPRFRHAPLARIQFAGAFLALFVLSSFAVGTQHPLYKKLRAGKNPYLEVSVLGDRLWVPPQTAELLRVMQAINAGIGQEERILIAPHWPGFYPILQRKSPWWDTYIAWNTSEHEQDQMIAALHSPPVDWIILGDVSLGGTYVLEFRRTHTQVWNYIQENYVPIEGTGLPQQYQLLKKHAP